MSIRHYEKNHGQSSTQKVIINRLSQDVPDPENSPMLFWTRHPSENTLVNLEEFAVGKEANKNGPNKLAGFSGRSNLILQIAPAIKASTLGLGKGSVRGYVATLRSWWRVFDSVEFDLSELGQEFDRIDDVRQFGAIHANYAKTIEMLPGFFSCFITIVNVVLQELGCKTIHFGSLPRSEVKRHLPPESETAVLRIELKQNWEHTAKRWKVLDAIRNEGFVALNSEEKMMKLRYSYYSEVQKKHLVLMPSTAQLYCEYDHNTFSSNTGFTLESLRSAAFPNRADVMSAFHICLATTGWNPSVLYTLDANSSDSFLYSHPQDSRRYLLIGTKVRSQGQEQVITGLWKTSWGPGPVIKKQLDRVSELRVELQEMLRVEKNKFADEYESIQSTNEFARRVRKIQHLEDGCKCVWLYVSPSGEIDWLRVDQIRYITHEGKTYSYLEVIVNNLNAKRAENGDPPIEKVTASDFRDIFALYVWRQTGGNILALMRVLNHKRLTTTQLYVDNNILNAEHNEQARSFVNNLFSELGRGRLDITIMAHLQRYGKVTEEMEEKLKLFRSLERSRINVGCKDPWRPPVAIEPESNNRRCGVQRCLLCKENSIILPESQEGIAMRTEELLCIQKHLSLESWLASDFLQELLNCLDALSLFPANSVDTFRRFWSLEIQSGRHKVPGLDIGGGREQ